jgi:translation elongation factor EF-1alpha
LEKFPNVGKVHLKNSSPLVVKKLSELEELGRFVLIKDGEACFGGIVTDEK